MAALRNPPPTYIEYCKKAFGFTPKTCWIADAKKQMGYDVKPAPNRREEERQYPCPEDKLESIKKAIRET
ncbi:MAG: hypothetical protein LBG43_04425 [Treponema sp.]|nr:hypothetical protein [Treponema sp.]